MLEQVQLQPKEMLLHPQRSRLHSTRDEARFNFNINGNYLSGSADTNTSAAMANAVTWETTQPFESSTLKTKLDALMVTLNSVHDKDIFEYNVDSATRSITFFQRDGGELNIGGFVTPESHKDMVATITPVTAIKVKQPHEVHESG